MLTPLLRRATVPLHVARLSQSAVLFGWRNPEVAGRERPIKLPDLDLTGLPRRVHAAGVWPRLCLTDWLRSEDRQLLQFDSGRVGARAL